MVIILILGILVLLIALSAPLGDASVALEQHQRLAYARESNYYVGRSAVELAMELLKVDEIDFDSSQDLWAFGNQRLSWEGKNIWLEIRDEESLFPIGPVVAPATNTTNTTPPTNTTSPTNVTSVGNSTANATASNSTTNSPDQEFFSKALERLCERAGLPGKEAVASLQDWVDDDEEVRPGGAEQGSYPAIHVKNGKLDSVEEIYLLSRWGPPTLPPPESLQPGTATLEEATKLKVPFQVRQGPAGPTSATSTVTGGSEWSDWLTLWSRGKVNLNTAPREVLRCLDPAMNDTILQEFVRVRAQKVLKSQEDLKKIPGIDQDLAFRLTKLGDFKSQHFRIRVVVDNEPGRLSMEAMVKRGEDHKLKVLFWRLF